MPRLVSAQPGDNPIQDYLERVAKYVPVEIVGAYLAFQSIFNSASPAAPAWVEFVFYGLLVIATAPYLLRYGGNVPRPGQQAVLGTISFVIWTYGINGAFFWQTLQRAVGTTILYPSISGGIVVAWSLVIGLVKPTHALQVARQPAAALRVGR
jgi:hypothetical protein